MKKLEETNLHMRIHTHTHMFVCMYTWVNNEINKEKIS